MICLTFDTDWAPQSVVEQVLESVLARNLSATVFATTPLDLPDDPRLEVALHPNLMADSTQGKDEKDILDNLQAWFPNALGLRTHRLYWRQGLAEELARRGLVYDASLFFPFKSHLAPVRGDGLVRFPGWWSDNLHMSHGFPFTKVEITNFQEPGLKIFAFHPMHILWNSTSPQGYREKLLRFQPLAEQKREALLACRDPGPGMGTFFETLLDYLANQRIPTYRLRDLL